MANWLASDLIVPAWLFAVTYLAGISIGWFFGRGSGLDARDDARRGQLHDAYDRGFDAGYGFDERLADARTEAMSGVRVYDYDAEFRRVFDFEVEE